jgi:hypothetical protein
VPGPKVFEPIRSFLCALLAGFFLCAVTPQGFGFDLVNEVFAAKIGEKAIIVDCGPINAVLHRKPGHSIASISARKLAAHSIVRGS